MRLSWIARGLPLWAGVTCLLATAPARAQLMSTWGHPVVTFGATPYNSVNTGHGNYPGSPGFIPGYGYYPGDMKGHYPWYDGPPIVGRNPRLAMPPPAEEAIAGMETIAPTAALLRVRLAADAELWVGSHRTTQRGVLRYLATPPLEEDREQWYELRARWKENGKEVERTESVRVHPGDRLTVDFQRGGTAEIIPAPRDFDRP